PWAYPRMHRRQCRSIGADGEERLMTQRLYPGKADHQVPARREQREHERQRGDVEIVNIADKDRNQHQHDGHKRENNATPAPERIEKSRHPRRSLMPSNPCGRNQTTRITSEKPITSRHSGEVNVMPIASVIPSRKPARMAPVKLPSPPIMTTTKAFRTTIKPIHGLTA